MKKPLAVDPSVLERLGELSRKDQVDCWVALFDLSQTFGRPHVHSGLGIRKLRPGIFECRAGLSLRFVFHDRTDSLYVELLGTHNEVQAYLKR